MKSRAFPSTFEPRYQELDAGKRVVAATSRLCATHASSASAVASIVASPCSSR